MAALSASQKPNGFVAEDLCLACGLCCNGGIFARVKLQPEDDPVRLQALGLPLIQPRGNRPSRTPHSAPRAQHFKQPCAAFDGCRCSIYAERPSYCRQFECLLLKSVKAGSTGTAAALRTIRTARERTQAVDRLLRVLGDTDEQTALSARFRRTARRLEEVGLDRKAAGTFGKLTLAMHDLNLILSQSFYPGR